MFLEKLIDKMNLIKSKKLNICSNGSSFFSFNVFYSNPSQLLFNKNDYTYFLINKKKINKNVNLDFVNNYKKKYLN